MPLSREEHNALHLQAFGKPRIETDIAILPDDEKLHVKVLPDNPEPCTDTELTPDLWEILPKTICDNMPMVDCDKHGKVEAGVVFGDDVVCMQCFDEATEREKEGEKMYDDYEPTKKTSLFEMAEKTVKGDRHKDYGSPAAMCEHIADMWNAYLGLPEDRKITPEQVPFMMVLFKMARESFKHKEDNLVDMMGYVGVADMVRRGE